MTVLLKEGGEGGCGGGNEAGLQTDCDRRWHEAQGSEGCTDWMLSDCLMLCNAAKGKQKCQLERSPPQPVSGVDLLVYVTGPYQYPVEATMMERLTVEELKNNFGEDAIVFVQNKNLQDFPRKLRGSLLWVAHMKIVGKIIVSKGAGAIIVIMFPNTRKGEEVAIPDLRVSGGFLEQVLGRAVGVFDEDFRKKEVNENSHEVKTPVDINGCIKMSIYGPDICKVTREEYGSVAQKMKMIPMMSLMDQWTTLNTEPVVKVKEGKSVPVVYVYSYDARRYTKVEMYVEDLYVEDSENEEDVKNDRVRMKPLVGVPFGRPKSSSSKWYVVVFEWCQ